MNNLTCPPGWFKTRTPSWNPVGQVRPAGPVGPGGPAGPVAPTGPTGPGGPGLPVPTFTVVVVVACVEPDRAVAARKPEPPASTRLISAIHVFLTDLDPLFQRRDPLLTILLRTLALRLAVPRHRDRAADGGAEGGDRGDLVCVHSRSSPVKRQNHQAHRDHSKSETFQRDVHLGHGSATLTKQIFDACERCRLRRITSPPLLLFDVDVFPSIAFQFWLLPLSKRPMWS